MPDLFDFFRENESKLHELPSEQTWSKLEGRLDRRRQKRGIRFLRMTTILVLLVVLLLALILTLFFLQ